MHREQIVPEPCCVGELVRLHCHKSDTVLGLAADSHLRLLVHEYLRCSLNAFQLLETLKIPLHIPGDLCAGLGGGSFKPVLLQHDVRSVGIAYAVFLLIVDRAGSICGEDAK